MLPDFDSMSFKELKSYAKDNNIDLGNARKRVDIVAALKQYYNIGNDTQVTPEATVVAENENKNIEEGSIMNEENVNLMPGEEGVNPEGASIANEMTPGAESADTNVPENTNTEAKEGTDAKADDKKVWYNKKGEEVSMSQFIREKFTEDNMSRKDISEKFDINYRTVYGATVNMTNSAEPASRGRGTVNPKIHVTADNKVLTETTEGEGDAAVTTYFLNGEAIKPGEDGVVEIPETVDTDRNSWIKEQVAAGVHRGDVAKILGLSYGVVYGLTKDADSTRQKYTVEIDDPENPGQKKEISRSEYIRMRVAAGVSKSDVAKELGVEYSVVWQATKKDKTDAEKFTDLVEGLAKYADKIDETSSVTKETFADIIDQLKAVKLAEPKEDAKEDKPADEAADKAPEADK